jgi:CheY-like chemotaxis protein
MVLMIDDDEDTLDIYRLLVEKTDHASHFVTRSSASAALEFLNQRDTQDQPFPKYILLDLIMPNQGGIDFIRSYEASYGDSGRDTTIMILTSSVRDSDHQEALQYSSVTKVVSKPLSKQLLVDLLVASAVA